MTDGRVRLTGISRRIPGKTVRHVEESAVARMLLREAWTADRTPIRIQFITREFTMLRWALIFFVIAIIAAVFGFGGIAGTAAGIAKIIFFVFLILFVLGLVMNATRKA